VSDTPLLDTVRIPEDVRKIAEDDLPALSAEIRSELIRVISDRGGHLAPNLGAVELTVALLRSFDLEHDRLVWDTGHQAYTYKLLTGRRKLFEDLRQFGGCCGFLHRDESPYDAFGAGHAGTAISAALGFASARDRMGREGKVVAVVGDGALGCGVSLEGLNSIIETTDDFILVINDNKMSIAPNVGALSQYLNKVISGEGYNRLKERTAEAVSRIPLIGRALRKLVHVALEATKGMLVPGTLFEELGLRYIGPLDGHDVTGLTKTFDSVRRLRQPTVVHVLTEKGRGYPHAEQAPEIYHGMSRFNVESGQPLSATGPNGEAREPALTFSSSLGDILCRVMAKDERVVAITAGMCHGTGLKTVREQFPDRLFDVGIAEEHAAVFAAGLAASGMKPVVAIYATFMQRAVDYVFHDVCLQKLPVVFCLDRAGVVEDGATHHGIHDLGFWRCVPELAVLQPRDAVEQGQMLTTLLERGVPAVMRYPKSSAVDVAVQNRAPLRWGAAETLRKGADVAIWAVGRETALALSVADDLAGKGIDAAVVNARFLLPFDHNLLREHLEAMPVIVLENHCSEGGFGSAVAEFATDIPGARVVRKGWPRTVLPWGAVAALRAEYGLDRPGVAKAILELVDKPQQGTP